MDQLFYNVIYAVLISFLTSIILSPIVIPILSRLKYGQTIRKDGPQTHLVKQGTPTMGGVVILTSFIVGALLFLQNNRDGLILVFVTIGYGVIGFLDDYIKIIKKRSLGLRAYQKLALQLLVTAVFAYFLLQDPSYKEIYIPFGNGATLNLGVLYLPFLFIVMLGTVNAVNLTDGLDGLAAGVTLLYITFFIFMALSFNSKIAPIEGAVVGSLLGFLLFNSYPAKVFMGDTGSLALGGFVATTAILLKMPIFILIVGLIYFIETLSVMIQVGYFKITKGKRFFKMAPIHHHFEKSGWSETSIVTLFYVITAIMCLIGFLATNNFAF